MAIATIERLTAESTSQGIVMVAAPVLTWTVSCADATWGQHAAEIEWASQSRSESVLVDGDMTVAVRWPFAPLHSGERGTLRVRIQGKDGSWSQWSNRQRLQCGVRDGWPAARISHPKPDREQCPIALRRQVGVREGLVSAVLTASAYGAFQAYVDGKPVDDERMKPGWTTYGRRDVYVTTDVTALLGTGGHELTVDLAGAWFTEHYGFNGFVRQVYGSQPSFTGVLRLEYEDGSVDEIATDASWEAASDGPIVTSELYAGEVHDARRCAADWLPVAVADVEIAPVPRTAPAVRAVQELAPLEILQTPNGHTVLDFGQNLVGHVRLKVSGPAGTAITLQHAEVMENGELGIRPLRRAKATDIYTLEGEAAEQWEPKFTFHGFRYVQVDGWPGELAPDSITAIAVGSDLRRTGTFDSSHPLLNQLHQNVVWSMRGNFLSIPTDCPQRDERMGWTGDTQVFAPTASFLFDTYEFLSSWLEDLAIEQTDDGAVPFVVPDVLASAETGTAAWGDAATLIPWTLYDRFGNKKVLSQQFPSMRSWVDWVAARAGENLLWEGDFQFADWLDPMAPRERPAAARTSKDLVATAHFYRSAYAVARSAEVLGDDESARRYDDLATRVRTAWLDAYATPAGRLMSDTPTAYALAIAFNIVDDARRGRMGTRLAELVEESGYRIATGFVGTPLITDALTDTGHGATAGRLLLNDECPSWLYPVTMGATTIWERWDSMLPDGSVNPGDMTSFNHYALGAVADWMHRRLAGLAPGAPGYRRMITAPLVVEGIDWAQASYESGYGTHRAGWERVGGDEVRVWVDVPLQTSATVRLPGSDDGIEVGPGRHEWTTALAAVAQASIDREFTTSTPLIEIRRDEPTYRAVRSSIEDAIGDSAAQDFVDATTWTSGGTFLAERALLPTGVYDAVDSALAALRQASEE
ncbi:alpha-L-rhamnosidase [Demequina aurantiaca]|uniref:alpha-L-rhamnosidase n=1 Tax=Demequina aurantiaca TaxID=676200 RepID=UPI0007802438|nr:alpha-L-rhamnosidase [Demequina aurantiaca]